MARSIPLEGKIVKLLIEPLLTSPSKRLEIWWFCQISDNEHNLPSSTVINITKLHVAFDMTLGIIFLNNLNTTKSSCVNARGIPTAAYQVLHLLTAAYQVLHLLSCTGGGSTPAGGTPCQEGYLLLGGTPAGGTPSILVWGYPIPGRGYPRVSAHVRPGQGTPVQGWMGYPLSRGGGSPIFSDTISEWAHCCSKHYCLVYG